MIGTTRNIEYFWGTTGSITFPAELQDSYQTLRSYNLSRYEGVKTTSLLYNTYSPATGSYIGDQSYGKTAALDHVVRKIGLFTQIAKNPFLVATEKNNVAIKYLVDESGSLTELNKRNKHWVEVQNTFKAAETLTVALFDNQKFYNANFVFLNIPQAT